ncbi:MAG TPA: GNAT family N-acetyltransferase [Gaiellaceae bacterium]|nr:GNAT family N-acetyltransferase [Gaiellaceae bacterium]
MTIRELTAADLGRIVEIDRSEHVTKKYVYDHGTLRAIAVDIEAPRWSPAYGARETERLAQKLDGGGVFLGAFDDERLVGVGVLAGHFIGHSANQLEVAFLHVSNGHRGRGIARRLLDELAERARRRGAEQLYISATETESAVGFYLAYGCELAERVDPELYALEPTDIHFTFALEPRP